MKNDSYEIVPYDETETLKQEKSSQPVDYELIPVTDEELLSSMPTTNDAPERTVGGTLKDIGITGLKGSIGISEAAIGLADIPTGGRAGKFAEDVLQYKPKEAKRILDTYLSPAQKYANAQVESADGFVDALKKSIENPSTIGHTVLESVPSMMAGGAAAKGIKAVTKIPGWVATGIGEGLVATGHSAESIRQQSADGLITPKQAGMSVAAGVGTGLIGLVGARIAKKYDFNDVDAMFAGIEGGADTVKKNVFTRMAAGGITEGVFEELPQTTQESIWMNAALDKPLLEGVPENAAIGLLSGTVMGTGANVVSRGRQENPVANEIDARFTPIESQGVDKLTKASQEIEQKIAEGTQLLQDTTTLERLAKDSNISMTELTAYLENENAINQGLVERIQEKLTTNETAETKTPQEVIEQERTIISMNEQIDQMQTEAANVTDPIQKNYLEDQIDILSARRDDLLNDTNFYQGFTATAEQAPSEQPLEGQAANEPDVTDQTTPEDLIDPEQADTIVDEQTQEETKSKEEIQALVDQLKRAQDPQERQDMYNELFDVKSAQESAEIFEYVDNEILTQRGTPYKNRVTLEKRIATFADPDNYIVAPVEDGFIGLKKPSTYNEIVAFKNEQQFGEPQRVIDEELNALRDQLEIPAVDFQTKAQPTAAPMDLPNIEKVFPGQQVTQSDDGSVSVRFKNGKGVTIKSVQDVGQGLVKLAIETGQMSKGVKILGVAVGTEILLDTNFADNETLWHENKHVLDNLGMITEADNAALNKEFNKLRKAGKLKFALSKAVDPETGKPDNITRMNENRANMFAQLMVERANYREDSTFNAMIQRIMDFFNGLLQYGQTATGLAREVESGKIYTRQGNRKDTPAMFQSADLRYTIQEQVLSGMINKQTETHTPEFAEWFSQSVAKTSEGEPLIFYHGTDGVFDTFSKDAPGTSSHTSAGLGHFFTLKRALAGKYGQHVLPTYLKLNKPYMMSLQEAQAFKTTADAKARQKALKADGYDSVIIETGDSPYTVIFDSGQAKSIYNQGQWKDSKNIYLQTREQPASGEQKISNTEYDALFKERRSLIQNIKHSIGIHGQGLKLLADKSVGTISTRLYNANPMLRDKIRALDIDTALKTNKVLRIAKPLLEKTKQMSAQDKHAWDIARKQADTVKIDTIAQRYGMVDDMQKLRDALDDIRAQAKEVGYDVGYIDDYWPRIIKDTEGFLKATQGISQRAEFTEAIKAKAKKMGISVEEFNRSFPDVRADVISGLILNKGSGIGGPSHIQGRVYNTIPKELIQYYANSDSALMQYIYSMTKKIETRKFFGKVPQKIQGHKNAIMKAQLELSRRQPQLAQAQDNSEFSQLLQERMDELNDRIALHNEALDKFKHQRDYTENIGSYVDGLLRTNQLKQKDEKTVREILEARFNEHGTTGVVNAYKNLAYIDVMGNPISAMTQMADVVWGAYAGKVWTPRGFSMTMKNLVKATLKKSDMTTEDLGLDRIAQEFADGTTLGNAVSKVFKVVGLTRVDSIGKEVLMNNVLMQYQDQIRTVEGTRALIKQIRPIFKSETNQVLTDLASNTHSDNVKMLVYSRLLDFQPAALSEMPELYLKGGNGRIFYMLKTYTIKQMDVFRMEVVREITSKDPKRVKQGLQNMVALTSMLTLANAGVDELKDFVLGKETSFKDNVIENFLTLGGASRYMQTQVTQDGIGTAMAQKILPPFKFVNAVSSDIREKIVTGDIEKGLRSVESIPSYGPIGGKLWYWHFGRGSEMKKTLHEKDFSKDTKRFTKFEKQLEKASDKRVFLHANKDEFRQMLLHRNFSKKLNENKAVINRLGKLEQTPEVIAGIGQYEKQRELLYDNYFKAFAKAKK